MTSREIVLGVVGPCASGKSTLVSTLRGLDYQVKHIAQEHSYVPDMWRQIGKPDFLIYLDVSFEVSTQRAGTSWAENIFNNQINRLKHARQHADLNINTDDLTPRQVLDIVLDHF
jgi:ABC-type glutathione transport system ATPase component